MSTRGGKRHLCVWHTLRRRTLTINGTFVISSSYDVNSWGNSGLHSTVCLWEAQATLVCIMKWMDTCRQKKTMGAHYHCWQCSLRSMYLQTSSGKEGNKGQSCFRGTTFGDFPTMCWTTGVDLECLCLPDPSTAVENGRFPQSNPARPAQQNMSHRLELPGNDRPRRNKKLTGDWVALRTHAYGTQDPLQPHSKARAVTTQTHHGV